jgi:hypothetical protein
MYLFGFLRFITIGDFMFKHIEEWVSFIVDLNLCVVYRLFCTTPLNMVKRSVCKLLCVAFPGCNASQPARTTKEGRLVFLPINPGRWANHVRLICDLPFSCLHNWVNSTFCFVAGDLIIGHKTAP